jgi:hypothetical protein
LLVLLLVPVGEVEIMCSTVVTGLTVVEVRVA